MTNNQTRNESIATIICSTCLYRQSDICNHCNSFKYHDCLDVDYLSLSDEEAAVLMGMTSAKYMAYCMDDNE